MQILYRLFRKSRLQIRQRVHRRLWLVGCLFLVFLLPKAQGEGSVDFINYPGFRLFYSANIDQQLKVYVNEGEFINLGTTHLGLGSIFQGSGGTISVYRPDGSLFRTYGSETSNLGIGLIDNSDEERAGPTGGGTTNGAGYTPIVVPVETGETGVWSITFNFPSPTLSFFDSFNLQNGDEWERTSDQPGNQRGILAWDVTVSQNGAGNEGGDLLTGRLFSNEYVSVVSNNGNPTSPTFYILTRDGYQYEVDFMRTDPFEFPLSSNSTGLIDGNLNPLNRSLPRTEYERVNSIENLDPNSFYQYAPQAMDVGPIINNKIFFNIPNPDMPMMATNTNIFTGETFVTWLYNIPQTETVSISNIQFISDSPDCDVNTTEVGVGGAFVFNTNTSGAAVIRLDVNEDGDYEDDIDVEIRNFIQAGQDTIPWDGTDGLGNSIIDAVGTLAFDLQIEIQSASIHIMVDDVENNLDGISFNLLNAPNVENADQFLYDHRPIGGPVSGSAVDGEPEPTNEPFTYMDNFGNEKLIDYFAFINQGEPVEQSLTINIVNTCSPDEDDFDEDGVADGDDIDDDNDGVLDRLEYCNPDGGFACLPGGVDPSGDEDGDGVQNFEDADDPAVGNVCNDEDADGVCDTVSSVYDTDGDGVPDHRDLDSDNDGITDLYEAGHGQADANGDGIIDGANADFGVNGFFNDIETDDTLDADPTYTRVDKDGDGVPDHDDLDSDNDGILDVAEAGYVGLDSDNDGRIDYESVNKFGIVNVIDPANTGEGIMNPIDFDMDGVPDFHDLDSDNDGINDVTEATLVLIQDPDGDGIIREGMPAVNSDGVAIIDSVGIILVISSMPIDFDMDGIPDYHDLDTDGDGILDAIEGFNGDFDSDFDGILGTGIPVVNDDGQVINSGTNSTSDPTNTDGDELADFRDRDSDDDGIADINECVGTDLCNDDDDDGTDDYREPNCTEDNTPAATVVANETGVFCSDTTSISYTVTNSGFNAGDIIYAAILPDGNILADTLVDNAATITVTNLNANGQDTMKVILVAENGCISDTVSVFIDCQQFECTPDNSPNIFVQTNTNGTACPGDSITYTIQSTGFQEGDLDLFGTFPDGQEITGVIGDDRLFMVTVLATDTLFTGDGLFHLVNENGCTSDTAQANIFIAKVDAKDDGFSVNSGETLENANILLNDDSRDVNVMIVMPPNNGMASIDENNNLVYTSNDGYIGQDTLTYSICNMTCMEICDTAQVIIENLEVECTPENTPELTVEVTTTGPSCPDSDLNFIYSTANFEVGATVNLIDNMGNIVPIGTEGNLSATIGEGGTYTFIATNPNGCSDSISIEIAGIDTLITANDDNYSILSGETLTANPIDNDEYNGGLVTITSNPQNGTASFDENNILTYLPNDGFIGMDTMTYQICDDNCVNICDDAQIIINVTEVVCDDTTSPDLAVNFDQDVTQSFCPGTVLSYDFENNGAGENIIINGVFADGNTIEGNLQLAGSITLNANTNGTATFIATADNGCADTVTVNIIVAQPVVANDDDYTITTGETLTGVNIFDNDTNNGGTFSIISNFQNGVGMIDMDGNLTYMPNTDFTGTDMLTYEICDAVCTDQCDQATVTINIDGCNAENSPAIGEFTITPDATVCPGDDLTFTVTNTGFAEGMITATLTLPNGDMQEFVVATGTGSSVTIEDIQNTADFAGNVSIKLTAENGCMSEVSELTLLAPMVNAVDDNYTIQVGETLANVNILDNDDVFPSGTITILDDFDNGSGNVAENGDMTYVPNDDFMGMDTLTYQVCDINCTAVCDTAQVIVNVMMVECNEETTPIVTAFTSTASGELCPGDETTLMITGGGFNEGEINYFITLPDGNTLVGTLNEDGTAMITIGNIAPNGAGTATVVLTAEANGCMSEPATLEIIIATVTANDDNYTTETDMTLMGVNVLDNDDADNVTITITEEPTNGMATIDENGNLTYVPNQGFAGTDMFTYQICDIDCPNVCDMATVTITVDDPCADKVVVANDDNYTTEQGMAVQDENVLTNDEFENVTFQPLTQPTNGVLAFQDDGTIAYVPNDDFFGTDSFTYEICDVECPDVCSSATVTITVNEMMDPCEDKMVVAVDDSYDTNQGEVLTDVSVLDNDDFEAVTITVGEVTGGTATIDADGNLTFTPDADFTGNATIAYTICDVECPDVCDAATVTVNVAPNVDPCENKEVDAIDDNYPAPFRGTLNDNVTTNDVAENVTVTLNKNVDNGTLTLNTDGTFTYTPNRDFYGNDTFSYRICDVECPDVCDEATVTIAVEDPACFIPNFITPNGDGDNDVFEIPCTDDDFPNNRLTIYNRWGDIIFETDNYQNNWGATHDGEPVAAGAYFYLFQPDRNSEECESGFITVIK